MTGRDDELARLRAENARLVVLLEAHGIAWQVPAPVPKSPATLSLTISQSASPGLYTGVKRGSLHTEPKAPCGGGESTAFGPKFFTTDEKVALFGRLFRGRTDVYPVRWESKAGKNGYAPACANEWRPGVCEKPRIKCGDCQQRQLLPLTDQVLLPFACRGFRRIGLA